jgi:hypothetical protein
MRMVLSCSALNISLGSKKILVYNVQSNNLTLLRDSYETLIRQIHFVGSEFLTTRPGGT